MLMIGRRLWCSQVVPESDLIRCAVVTAPVVDWMKYGEFHARKKN